MKISKEKKILAGLALVFAVLVFVALMLLGSATEQRKTAAWVAHTRDVLEKINELVTHLSDAENGRRGYVLSGDDRYLSQHTNRVGRVQAALRELRELTRDNPDQSAACNRLEGMIRQLLAIFTNSIKARQENALDLPAQSIFMEQGQQAMDPIRQLAARMTTKEKERLEERQATQDKNVEGTQGFAVLVSLFGLGLFAALFVLFSRADRRRHLAEEAVRQLNADLEQRVKERTTELTVTNRRLKEEVDERNRVARLLLENEASFRLMFANNPLPMWVYDRGTLQIREVNDVAVARYGYSRPEFLQMRIADLRSAEERTRLSQDAAQPREAFESSSGGRHRLKDGRTIDVEVLFHPLEFAGHESVLMMAQDITERRRVEAEILRLNQELEDRVAQRTAQLEAVNKELEAFTYSVSHDLRAPLRHIDGYVGMLQQGTDAPANDSSARYLQVISSSAKRMGALIDDLLTFSQMGRAELRQRSLNMDELVSDVLREMGAETQGRNIAWERAQLPEVVGDRALLKQVWVNLLSNAIKYTRHREPARIRIGWSDRETEAEFFVQDNGAGFDMNYAHKLFGVFQRLHQAEEFEGTGIGLANVRRIITRHGGRTWAEGAVDKGATVHFTLPKRTAS